jgi:asparagine synthase (glutamine-hydrolysing)
MPGIVGLITKMPRKWAEPQLRRMVESIHHESFYSIGTWIDESLGVYVGWAARKGSFSDGMPLLNEKENVILIFSGEEYPEPGIRSHLKKKGHTFAPDDGPIYLPHLYEEDPDFLLGLNGRFHGLLVDQSRGTSLLFNDRYGMHRTYYHESKEAFYFSAEAKAILNVRPELRRADPRALGEFVSLGCVVGDRTLFEDIHVLPSGSAWTFSHGAIEKKRIYFTPSVWEQQDAAEAESYYKQLKEAFSRNLPRYLNGHEPMGMSLTGGLDTRTVMAWQKFAPNEFPCYTYGGTYRECEDVTVARKVVSVCQQPYQVIPVDDTFLGRFAHYAERSVYLTDGCVDLLRCPDLYVSEKAREIAPVRITGLYGDEVLRCARAFKPMATAQNLFRPEFLANVRQAEVTYAELVKEHPLSFSAFRQAPWHHHGILMLEQSQLTVRTPFLDNDLIRTLFRAPKSAMENNEVRLRLIGDGNSALRQIRTDRGFGGPANSLTGAAARHYQQFTFKAEYAYDYGMPQWLSRVDGVFRSLHLERLFLGRHKVYHFRVWYRDKLAEYVREMLLDSRTLARPYLECSGVEEIVRGHLKGNRNYTLEIHKILTLELIHRLFLDSQ